jgi:hypothetical protein
VLVAVFFGGLCVVSAIAYYFSAERFDQELPVYTAGTEEANEAARGQTPVDAGKVGLR